MSECATARDIIGKYCEAPCLELGFGGVVTVPHAISFDMPQPYCPSFEGHPQMLRGDCRSLPFICDEAFSSLVSHHLLEDFSYGDLIEILKEWRRVLRTGGYLVTNCPDQQKYLRHCEANGQGINLAHCEADFSLSNFKEKVIPHTGAWEVVFEEPNHGPYSWLLVLRKI